MKMPIIFRATGRMRVTAMKRTVGTLALQAALGTFASPALAQYAPQTVQTLWQGPYVGANLGYQWSAITGNPTRPNGFAGGAQAGYNWQSNQIVFGAETDIQFSGADDTFAPWKFSNPWFGTLRGRVGFAMSNILLYGTGGLAYGSVRVQNMVTGASESKIHPGWAIGAGMEVALTTNWSARAEYLYVDLSDRSYGLTGTSNGSESSVVRFGVNYRF
jgi:outer membrane immunogenic protein